MSRSVAAKRVAIVDTVGQTLQAVESVRALGNALASEQDTLKARIVMLEARQTELAALLENYLAERRAGDAAAKTALDDRFRVIVDEIVAVGGEARGASETATLALDDAAPCRRGLLGRLTWLVTGR